jgi:hypothetical protein
VRRAEGEEKIPVNMALDLSFYLVKPDAVAQFSSQHARAFYDVSRCTATLDHLLHQYGVLHQLPVPEKVFWQGGVAQPLADDDERDTPVHVYHQEHIADVFGLLLRVDVAQLLSLYNYEELLAQGVYKPARPDQLEYVKETYHALRDLFGKACADECVVVREII